MFVHHPDAKYARTERVGSRTVPFVDGRAEVTVPHVLRHYRDLGYQITEDKRRPATAGHAEPQGAPLILEQGEPGGDDDD